MTAQFPRLRAAHTWWRSPTVRTRAAYKLPRVLHGPNRAACGSWKRQGFGWEVSRRRMHPTLLSLDARPR